MSDPFNLDLAVEERDKPDPFTFTFGGDTYECRSPNEMDIRKVNDRLEQDPASILRMILGPDGWDRLDASDHEFTVAHMQVLTEQWVNHYGLDLPKSGGSRTSSTKRTVR